MDNLLIFGGTFDPIHYGHINTAINVQQFFHFEQFAFLPCKIPVLNKQSLTAPSQHRLAMLNLALAEQKKHYHFYVASNEIARDSPSYTLTTLNEFRNECGKALPITLLLGFDVFCQLSQWNQWQQLIELANLLVINRAGYDEDNLPVEMKALLLAHETTNPKALLKTPHGLIARFDAGNYDISSTRVRGSLISKKPTSTPELDPAQKSLDVVAGMAVKDKKSPINLLPNTVYHYILDNKLYSFK
ncbi:MAG: nicotinate (nicotinamide) nucleotide adenylyltransferase [Legionellales bacterium RIFCSPHIGHO2_12_FULL_42_9]|nr:MAG: nicotinate (nicotinamide) nucleotide adenylyltransferase [Legionellales bacterium RIFCSPHIGHO2_12_FULL_42_9]